MLTKNRLLLARGVKRAGPAVALALVLTSGSGVAWAGSDPGTGSDIATAQERASVDASNPTLLAAKTRLATAWTAFKATPGSASALQKYKSALAAVGSVQGSLAVSSSMLGYPSVATAQQMQVSAVAGTSTTPSFVAASTLTSNSVYVTQHPQATSYYCGPSAGQSIAERWRATSKDGQTASQTLFASSGWMATAANGTTAWASGKFPYALNRYIFGLNANGSLVSTFYVAKSAPTASNMLTEATIDIDGLVPMAEDAVYFYGASIVLNGHPNNATRGHWIAIYGYNTSAQTLSYADPASGSSSISWGGGVPAKSTMSASSLSYMAQSNGVVW